MVSFRVRARSRLERVWSGGRSRSGWLRLHNPRLARECGAASGAFPRARVLAAVLRDGDFPLFLRFPRFGRLSLRSRLARRRLVSFIVPDPLQFLVCLTPWAALRDVASQLSGFTPRSRGSPRVGTD